MEGQNITLGWNYNLSDHDYYAEFDKVTDGGSMLIAITHGGSSTVVFNFPKRFRAHISYNQARLTILKVQTSDQGKYQFVCVAYAFLIHSRTWWS